VPRGLVQLELADVRGEDLRVALLAQLLADEVLQLLADDRAVGRPQDEPLADVVVDDEEPLVAPDRAVVAQPRLLALLKVGRQLLRVGKVVP